MESEQAYIDAINADPDDRTLQLVYSDFLDELGDLRAEGWRVLIEAGKRPENKWAQSYDWWLGPDESREFPEESQLELDEFCGNWFNESHDTFHAAMDAAAIAWVRCHRKPKESATLLQ